MKRPSILDTNRNWIDLYIHAAGEWTTPPQFHRWSAISLIAASLEDRVWIDRLRHANLHPNVWVFLIADSGVGKDHAIGLALSYFEEEDPVQVIDGKVTIPALYDYMSDYQKSTGKHGAPVYLVSADVTEQLPLGNESRDFTSRVLAMYGGRSRTMRDITRTSGIKKVQNPLVNWLGGCVPEWFPQAIDPLIFNSGFCGRAFFIVESARYDYYNLKAPLYPPDTEMVRDRLRMRLEHIQHLEGLFIFEEDAKREEQAWLNRAQHAIQAGELSETDRQVLNRQRAGLLKLSMIFAIADWVEGDVLRITRRNVALASHTLGQSIDWTKQVQDFAYTTPDTKLYTKVMDLVRAGNHHEIQLSRLSEKMYHRGVRGTKHMDEILGMLKQSGNIRTELRKSGKSGGPRPTFIIWTPRTIPIGALLREEDNEEGEEEEADRTGVVSGSHPTSEEG